MHHKQYKFTVHDIAKGSCRNVGSIIADRRRKKFDPKDLLSVCMYVVGWNLVKTCGKEIDVDKIEITGKETLDLVKEMIKSFEGGQDE